MTRLTARVQKVWFCIFISLATSFYLKLLLFSSLECVLIVLFTVFQISCCNLSSPVFPMLRSDCEPCRCKRLDSFFFPHTCRGFACLLRGLTVAIESIFWPFGIDKLGIDFREQRFFSSTFSLFTSKMVTNIQMLLSRQVLMILCLYFCNVEFLIFRNKSKSLIMNLV